jgi:aspartate carbamoyltransferase regulatory subunit
LLLFVAVVATYDTEHFVYGMEEGLHRLVVGDALRVVALYDALQRIRSLDGLLLYDFVVFDDTQSDVRRNDRESVDFLIGKILVGNLDDALLANLLAWQVVAEKTYQVVNLLQLEKMETPVTIGYNLPSKKIGKKGIIKVANKYFTDEEINRLSVVAPNIGLSIIKDYEIVEKKTVKTPDTLKGIVKCNNPKCITNNEPMQTLFHTVDKVLGIVRCHYCDKEQQLGKVELCK